MLWMAALSINYVLAFALAFRVLHHKRDPLSALFWIGTLLGAPIVGLVLYFGFGVERVPRSVRHRLAVESVSRFRVNTQALMLHPHDTVLQHRLGELSVRVGGSVLTRGNHVAVLNDSDAAYDAMRAALQSARHHIHMQSYIWRGDDTGRGFAGLLTEKARQGVQVRVMTDGFGSFSSPASMFGALQAAGGHVNSFYPLTGLARLWPPNLRNHRKIIVVDGTIGFTGGFNIGDEYRGAWRDTHVRIEGPSVVFLQETFAEGWDDATGEKLEDEAYFPDSEAGGDHVVQVVSSGPDRKFEVLFQLFFAGITGARNRVFLTTPYFVPDRAMLAALRTAALRGLDVRVLVPRISDFPISRLAARSFYLDLLEAGVRLFEYERGILHAKTLVVDGIWSTIGSANMDKRSFRLNFETNVSIYGADVAEDLERQFERDLDHSREITEDEIRRSSYARRTVERCCALLAPLL